MSRHLVSSFVALLLLAACEAAPPPEVCSPEAVREMLEETAADRDADPDTGAGGSPTELATILQNLTATSEAPERTRLVHRFLEVVTVLSPAERRSALNDLAEAMAAGEALEFP